MNRTQTGASARIGRASIRLACSGDRDAIRDFLTGLSPRSRHLRFFTGAAPSSGAMLAILAGGGDNIDVVVAAQGDGAIIGHAMAVDTTKPDGACTTEIGVVVADAWQGRGIGSALVRTLTNRARARGATTLVMDVLAENRPVLAMIARRWPDAHHQHCAAWVAISAELPDDRPLAAARPSPMPGYAAISRRLRVARGRPAGAGWRRNRLPRDPARQLPPMPRAVSSTRTRACGSRDIGHRLPPTYGPAISAHPDEAGDRAGGRS